MFRRNDRKGRKPGESLMEPDRNRPGPRGLGRNRTGDPPKQRCGWWATREGSKGGRKALDDPDPPTEESPALTGAADDQGKVGAGGNTGPHYFVGRQRSAPAQQRKPHLRPAASQISKFLAVSFRHGRAERAIQFAAVA